MLVLLMIIGGTLSVTQLGLVVTTAVFFMMIGGTEGD